MLRMNLSTNSINIRRYSQSYNCRIEKIPKKKPLPKEEGEEEDEDEERIPPIGFQELV